MTQVTPTQNTCQQCKHYYITWETAHPFGCHYFKFKSHRQPYLAVIDSSRNKCLAFEPKTAPKNNQGGQQNNKKGWIA